MYLKDQLEKIVINLVIDQPQFWPRVKAGWFYGEASSAVAKWIWSYNRMSGLMPTRTEIIEGLKTQRLKTSIEEIKLLLQPIVCDLEHQKSLLEFLEIRGMMFELMEDHISEPQSHGTVILMKHIGERMKVCQSVPIEDYLFVSKEYGKIKKKNENKLQHRSQTFQRRSFQR